MLGRVDGGPGLAARAPPPGGDLTSDSGFLAGDLAVQFWDGGTPVNLGLRVDEMVMSESWIAVLKSIGGLGQPEFAVHQVCDPIGSCDWITIDTPIFLGDGDGVFGSDLAIMDRPSASTWTRAVATSTTTSTARVVATTRCCSSTMRTPAN